MNELVIVPESPESDQAQSLMNRLYESAGYKQILPYGRYVGDPLSVCFEKEIVV